jgi:O-antigen ligase
MLMEFYESKSNIFTGYGYPLVLAALVIAGYFTGLEVYTIMIGIILTSIALWTSNTIKPFLFFIITVAYQLPKVHLYPSDYYTTGHRPYILLGSIALLLISLVVFIIKNSLFKRAKITEIPLFFPLCLMTVGMMLNGAMNPDYKPMNAVWAALMMLVYFFLYVVIYLGIRGEDPKSMVSYFSYMTILTSWILLLQMAKIYFVDGVIVNGVLDRGQIMTGYGVCNHVGFHISTLIPMNFYGFMRGRTPALSLTTAVLLWIATLATTSRNAALIGTVYFVFCLIFSMIYGKRVVASRIMVGVAAVILVATSVVLIYYHKNPHLITSDFLRDVIDSAAALIKQYVDRGMGSSGRTDIWRHCVEIFKENPIFGTGFFGMQVAQQFVPEEYIPEYAHNTFFELIAATGIVGTLSYGFYRIATIRMMLRKFELDRFMLILGASVLVAESLLDNYVFQIYTTFYYVIAFAIAARLMETQTKPDNRIELM